jgi:hypothetical protein
VIAPLQRPAEGIPFRGGLIATGSGPYVTENKQTKYSAAFLPVEMSERAQR